MENILLCEICREPISRFNPDDLCLPINLHVFKSLYPERAVPDPFPANLDDWKVAACPRCRRRPFFNHFDRGDGTVIVSSGEAVKDGEQWFVMILGDCGLPEKMVLSSPMADENKPAGLPPQELTLEISIKNTPTPDLGVTFTTTTIGPIEAEDQEPTGNYKSPPVTCPKCGKKFRSAGRMAKYHNDCTGEPPREGLKI